MRLAVTRSPEQALSVLCEASAAPGTHSAEQVLDAAEVVLSAWVVEMVLLTTGQWLWMWHEQGHWSPPFGSRREATADAVERRMRPATQVVERERAAPVSPPPRVDLFLGSGELPLPNEANDRAQARKMFDALSDLLSAADSLEEGDDAAATAGLGRVREALNGVEVPDLPDWAQFAQTLAEVYGIQPSEPTPEEDNQEEESRIVH